MEAKKNILLDLPDEVEIGLVDKIKYNTVESQVAFYNLLIKEGEKYYKRENLWDDKLNRDLIGLLVGEVHSLKEDLERERKNNKPLGFMFSNIVIEIELDMYDTIEEQIEYLKRKIKEFDTATINVYTNEYDDLKDKLKQFILSRYSLLKNKNCDWDDFLFDELWSEIVDTHFDPYRINNAIDRAGKNKTEKFRDFMKENFNRFTIDEWMREYDTKDKLSRIDGIKQNERLSELDKHLKSVGVWDNNLLDCDLGKETLGRLKLFEEKFVKVDSSTHKDNEKKIKTDVKPESEDYHLFNYEFENIKKYAKELSDENKYKYYARIEIEIKRILNAFTITEFKNFDGNIYFGLREFKESCEHILKKEKCPELNTIVKKQIDKLNEDANEQKFRVTLFAIEMDIMLENNRLAKTSELIGYEIEYLEKILSRRDGTGTETVKKQIIDKIMGKNEVNEKKNTKDENFNESNETINNELKNAHSIIIKQRNKIKSLEKGITKTDLLKMIDENKCRMKNGKINYSVLGKILGCSNHTAKSKCKHFGIS